MKFVSIRPVNSKSKDEWCWMKYKIITVEHFRYAPTDLHQFSCLQIAHILFTTKHTWVTDTRTDYVSERPRRLQRFDFCVIGSFMNKSQRNLLDFEELAEPTLYIAWITSI